MKTENILVIDHGNTITKFTNFVDGKGTTHKIGREYVEAWLPELTRWINSPLNAIVWSHTGSKSETIKRALKRIYYLVPFFEITRRTPLPVGIKYATPETLGYDRIAAAAGAVDVFGKEAVVIADAGTALTLDIVSADGNFVGGNISAGVGLKLRALHRYTGALPIVNEEGDMPEIGYDTQTAMRSGTVYGTAAEIAWMAGVAVAEYGCHILVLTGGYAHLLEPKVKEILSTVHPEMRIVTVPDLVGRGLLSIYKYNEAIK